jgi:hypothetical protein
MGHTIFVIIWAATAAFFIVFKWKGGDKNEKTTIWIDFD